MVSTTLSEFRKDVDQYLDRVIDDADTIIINRGKEKGVVIMSLSEFNSINTTIHEMSSKKNQDRLDSSIEKVKSGRFSAKNLFS